MLAACGGQPAPTPTSATSPSAQPAPMTSPTPTVPPIALPDDAVLLVQATATAADGAALDLAMVVLRSTAWDDPSAQDRPALMTQECAGSFDESVYESGLWSFARIEVSATPRSGSDWQGDRVTALPLTDHVAVVSTGFPADDDQVDPATPYCARSKFITGPGEGVMVVGFRGDTDAVGAAGGFTRWANHHYGFVAGTDVVLTDCTAILTALGSELGADGPQWSSEAGSGACRFGNLGQEDDDR
jgi:hypothetical protein